MNQHSMIERVATAIETIMFSPHELPLDDELHGKYLITARAAIAAMREPSDAIVNKIQTLRMPLPSGGSYLTPGRDGAVWLWQAIIDAALEEKP